jgi:hypothetical protein
MSVAIISLMNFVSPLCCYFFFGWRIFLYGCGFLILFALVWLFVCDFDSAFFRARYVLFLVRIPEGWYILKLFAFTFGCTLLWSFWFSLWPDHLFDSFSLIILLLCFSAPFWLVRDSCLGWLCFILLQFSFYSGAFGIVIS